MLLDSLMLDDKYVGIDVDARDVMKRARDGR